MNIKDFAKKKAKGQKVTMVTSYDYWSAQIINASDVDCILVGDSAAMIMHGHTSTLPATTEIMAWHTAAVVRGAPDKFIVSDLPFLSYRKGLHHAMDQVEQLMQAGAHAIKLEGVDGNEEIISHIVQSGVPVMGHIGLTPQAVHQLGGYKVQGRSNSLAAKLIDQAKRLEQAGAFSVVLECVPSPLAKTITQEVSISTIGIGAGADTDGQVLVFQDLLGLNSDFKPKFVKTYLDGKQIIKDALNSYHHEVGQQAFPDAAHSFEA